MCRHIGSAPAAKLVHVARGLDPRVHLDRKYSCEVDRLPGLRTEGVCREDARGTAKGLRCAVECDGGGVFVVHRATDLMMYLDRIRVVSSCADDAAESGEELSGGKDDREFRLDRVNDSVCDGMTP
jgi:hypothetical protein